MANDLFRWNPFGVVELNNTADDGWGEAQGCQQADDDKEGGGFEHAGVRRDAVCLVDSIKLDCQVR